MTTRGVCLSRNSASKALRTSGELDKSMRPVTSRIVMPVSRRWEICTIALHLGEQAQRLPMTQLLLHPNRPGRAENDKTKQGGQYRQINNIVGTANFISSRLPNPTIQRTPG